MYYIYLLIKNTIEILLMTKFDQVCGVMDIYYSFNYENDFLNSDYYLISNLPINL